MSITVKQMQPRSRDAAHVKSPVVGIVPISKSQRHKRQGQQIFVVSHGFPWKVWEWSGFWRHIFSRGQTLVTVVQVNIVCKYEDPLTSDELRRAEYTQDDDEVQPYVIASSLLHIIGASVVLLFLRFGK